jgi:hypothetical protein
MMSSIEGTVWALAATEAKTMAMAIKRFMLSESYGEQKGGIANLINIR